MCPRRIYIKGRTAFRGVIREVICFLVVVVLFCKMCSFSTIFHRSRFDSELQENWKKKVTFYLGIYLYGHPAFPTKSRTSFKTAYLWKILNFLLVLLEK